MAFNALLRLAIKDSWTRLLGYPPCKTEIGLNSVDFMKNTKMGAAMQPESGGCIDSKIPYLSLWAVWQSSNQNCVLTRLHPKIQCENRHVTAIMASMFSKERKCNTSSWQRFFGIQPAHQRIRRRSNESRIFPPEVCENMGVYFWTPNWWVSPVRCFTLLSGFWFRMGK